MVPLWLYSWYQHQQAQSQEPFNDQYEAADGEGDWVEVITPSIKRRQPRAQKNPENNHVVKPAIESNNVATNTLDTESLSSATTTVVATVAVTEPVVKGLSRQERRAKARFAVKENKKHARNAVMVTRSKGKSALNLPTSCLPSIGH